MKREKLFSELSYKQKDLIYTALENALQFIHSVRSGVTICLEEGVLISDPTIELSLYVEQLCVDMKNVEVSYIMNLFAKIRGVLKRLDEKLGIGQVGKIDNLTPELKLLMAGIIFEDKINMDISLMELRYLW